MLSKKDLQKIEEIVRRVVNEKLEVELQKLEEIYTEVIYEALTPEVKYEKNKDEKTGQPLATPELITQKEFIPAWWVRYLPHYEAAMRGVQSQVSIHSNEINEVTKKIDAVGHVLLNTQQSILQIASIANKLKQLEFNEAKKIEYVEADLDEENDESNS